MVGVMIGRAIASNPVSFWDTDRRLYGAESNPETVLTRRALVEGYAEYLHDRYDGVEFVDLNVLKKEGNSAGRLPTGNIHMALKPVHGILSGLPGNKRWRNALDTCSKDPSLRQDGPAGVLLATLRECDGSFWDNVVDKGQR